MAVYQSIEPLSRQLATPFRKSHIKSKCVCSDPEKTNINNVLSLTPDLHSMFDGPEMATPLIRMRATGVDGSPVRLETYPGVWETKAKVTLIVEF